MQKNLLLVFPPLASPRVISLQQRARVLFGDGFANIEFAYCYRQGL
jgi:hypothetical protein